PLGVVRSASVTRRRLWWRLAVPVLGLVLLVPLADGMATTIDQLMVVVGLVLLLTGIALLLPWIVDAVVRRLGPGGVAWELAVRRLQLESGTAVRAVSAIVVSVAGLIALQGTFSGILSGVEDNHREDAAVFQAEIFDLSIDATDNDWVARLAGMPGVRGVETALVGLAQVEQSSDEPIRVEVGSCAILAHETGVTQCADGDVVVVTPDAAQAPTPGTEYVLGEPGAGGTPWELPADARTVEVAQEGSMTPASGVTPTWIFVTPSALGETVLTGGYVPVLVALDPTDPDAVDRLRTAAAQIDPTAHVASFEQESLTGALGSVRQALLVGTIALLVVVGASLLVNVAEQLRERRRPLAVLAAFGARRRTLGLSVLWQVAIPVALGITLAAATGTGLSAVLQVGVDAPVGIDWRTIGLTSGGAALVVMLVTVASLPLLARLTRAEALHAE
ncbi:MAG: ABC transporter permease, partial [Cellulomonadaceae bacterium]|nr:ABC transporter permease [Cellulomonadaceae bacterium]